MGYPNMESMCRALGHHGICPEGLETIGKIAHFLNDEAREEYDRIMKDLREMFAPVEDDG